MSWNSGKSVITYADLYSRTTAYGGTTYTLKPGQSLTNTKLCIKVTDAKTKLNLNENFIPSGLPSGALAIRDWIQAHVVVQVTIPNFTSPLMGVAIGNYIYYPDADLGGVVYFNPTTLTDGTNASFISIPSVVSGVTNSRPSGCYYHEPTNKLYVNSFYGGGLSVIDISTNTLSHTISYGTDGASQRGNIFYVSSLDEIWCLGNGGSLRIDATTETQISSSFTIPSGTVYITGAFDNIYLFNDFVLNQIQVYDINLNLIKTVDNLCLNESNTGNHVSRGYYNDNNYFDGASPQLYVGEFSNTGGVTVFDTNTNEIVNRIQISSESLPYTAVAVIAYHPIRNAIYVGGSILTDASDQTARLWVLNTTNTGVADTITPTVNNSISSINYYSNDNNVYIASPGAVGTTDTDGNVFKYN